MHTGLTLQPATASDSDAVFAWRNDPVTRAASVTQGAVPRHDHDVWYDAVLASELRHLYIARVDGERVGLCRFDTDEATGAAEVSINLNPDFRGRGLAGPILSRSIERFRSDVGRGVSLTATIRPENAASLRIFLAVGFVAAASEPGLEHFVLLDEAVS